MLLFHYLRADYNPDAAAAFAASVNGVAYEIIPDATLKAPGEVESEPV